LALDQEEEDAVSQSPERALQRLIARYPAETLPTRCRSPDLAKNLSIAHNLPGRTETLQSLRTASTPGFRRG
jgi:hypothetical protein